MFVVWLCTVKDLAVNLFFVRVCVCVCVCRMRRCVLSAPDDGGSAGRKHKTETHLRAHTNTQKHTSKRVHTPHVRQELL